jgi:hypothetical protein
MLDLIPTYCAVTSQRILVNPELALDCVCRGEPDGLLQRTSSEPRGWFQPVAERSRHILWCIMRTFEPNNQRNCTTNDAWLSNLICRVVTFHAVTTLPKRSPKGGDILPSSVKAAKTLNAWPHAAVFCHHRTGRSEQQPEQPERSRVGDVHGRGTRCGVFVQAPYAASRGPVGSMAKHSRREGDVALV